MCNALLRPIKEAKQTRSGMKRDTRVGRCWGGTRSGGWVPGISFTVIYITRVYSIHIMPCGEHGRVRHCPNNSHPSPMKREDVSMSCLSGLFQRTRNTRPGCLGTGHPREQQDKAETKRDPLPWEWAASMEGKAMPRDSTIGSLSDLSKVEETKDTKEEGWTWSLRKQERSYIEETHKSFEEERFPRQVGVGNSRGYLSP